jgi:hypothetical protein
MLRNVSARERRDRPTRAQLASVGLAAGLLLVLGCEGENIFVDDITPPEVEILDPLSGENVPPDGSVLVRARVADSRGVVRVTIRGVAVRTDPTTGQDHEVARLVTYEETFPSPVRNEEIEAQLASIGQGTEPVFLIVTAVDEAGNIGADTVDINVGGPRVEVREPTRGQTVRAGMQIPVHVWASDPTGVNLIEIEYSGVVENVIQFPFSPVQDTLLVTTLTLPATSDSLRIRARATNTAGIVNRSTTVAVMVASATDADVTPPTVAFDILAPQRVELTDSVRVTVSARDDDGGTGLASVGVSVIAISAPNETMVVHRQHNFSSPQVGLTHHTFVIGIQELYAKLGAGVGAARALPDTLQFEFHAVAHDAAGNCAAATGTSLAQAACGERTVAGETIPVAQGAIGRRAQVMVVEGRTVLISGGGVIADALVDHGRRQLYLSNYSRNRVEKLDLQTLTFRPGGIDVGSQPWGLFMHNNGDTLIVANSGGTNLEFVGLGATGEPLGSTRLQTPNVALFQVQREEMEAGGFRYTVTFLDFSDRPQFVAQDVYGNLLYSTVPTGSAPDGTVRVAWREPDWDRWEVELLLADARTDNVDGFAISNVDHVNACTIIATGEHGIYIRDRTPGSSTLIDSGCESPAAAYETIKARGSDIRMWEAEEWDASRIGMSDTTFVAASGDRRRIVFGEGAAVTGRIFMWHAHQERAFARISDDISVVDLIHNEPARITGLDLNRDGTLGIARGQEGTYFFDSSLRLQGRVVEGVGRGASAALHPNHIGIGTGTGAAELSFVGTDRNSIMILDTYRFLTLGEIPIRDQLAGPLKVSPPLPGDPADTVVRIYAVTSVGGALLVRVRQSDINR